MIEINLDNEVLRPLVQMVAEEIIARQRSSYVLRDSNGTAPKLLLSALEAAVAIGVSERKFWEMVKEGELPKPIRVGRKSLWSVEELREWIRQKKAAPANN